MNVKLDPAQLDEAVRAEMSRLKRENTNLKGKLTRLEAVATHHSQQLQGLREADAEIRKCGDWLKSRGFTYVDYPDTYED